MVHVAVPDLLTLPPHLYVHVPFCRRKCDYCGFASVPLAGHDVAGVVEAMLAEAGAARLARPLQTAYLGGGSPTALPLRVLDRLLGGLVETVGRAGEFTAEANPGQVDQAVLEHLRALGVNRLSLGGQSFDRETLRFLTRPYGPEAIDRAVAAAVAAGFENIALDLIFAVPGSDPRRWETDLDRALHLPLTHLSTYSLTWESGTPLMRRLQAGRGRPCAEELDRRLYERAIEKLTAAGFEHYEVSNFCRPGWACRHNLAYWANADYIGIGPGAAAHVRGRRWENRADVVAYRRALAAGRRPPRDEIRLDPAEQACETAVLNLRRREGLQLEAFAARTGFDFLAVFAEPVGRLLAEGALERYGDRVRLSPAALPVADAVLCEFASFPPGGADGCQAPRQPL